MSGVTQSLIPEKDSLSPWWIRAVPLVIASIKGYLGVRAADRNKDESRYTDDGGMIGQWRQEHEGP